MYNLLTKIIVNPVIIIGALIKQKILFLIDVYLFVCENNPLLLDYYEKEKPYDWQKLAVEKIMNILINNILDSKDFNNPS